MDPDRPGVSQIWPVASLAVTASILAHGFTATPLTALAGQHVRR